MMETNFDNPLPPPEPTTTSSTSSSAASSAHSSPVSREAASAKKMFKRSSSFETDVTSSGKEPDTSVASETRSTLSEETMLINETIDYTPLDYHWFYVNHVQDKKVWLPMSFKDSASLERAYTQNM
jgi:hypothetical protein